MALKNIENNIQELKFPINVYTSISDIQEIKKEYPFSSNFKYDSMFGSGNVYDEVVGNKFFPAYMPSNEIARSMYRSGVENFNDLTSFVKDGILYVKPGEYSIQGTVFYLNYLNYQNLATNTLNQELLVLPTYTSKASLNFFKAGVYKDQGFWMAPSEHNVAGEYRPQSYIGYSFTDNQNLWVNNYYYRTDTVKCPVISKRFYEADFDINSQSLETYGELLGISTGDSNQYFNTVYSPITQITTTPGTLLDSKTHIAVDTDGTIDFYTLKNSYMEAELFGLEEILKQIVDNPLVSTVEAKACYVNRYKGEVFFGKQTLSGPITSLSLPSEGGGMIEDGVVIPSEYITSGQLNPANDPYFVITFDEPAIANMFDDCGLVRIDGLGSYASKNNVLIFNKIGSKTVQFRWPDFDEYEGDPLYTKETFGNKIYISPYCAMFIPEEDAKVYALYDAVIEFQKEVPTVKREFLSSEIKPWFWKNQRTIAVLSKSEKVYPYYISLRPVDSTFLYTRNGSSVYGPIYNGAEIVLLEGEVTSYDGQPIAEQEVAITVLVGQGTLDGEVSITATTDDEGKFYTSYDPKSLRSTWLNFKDGDVSRNVIAGTTTLTANAEYNNPNIFQYINDGEQEVIVYTILKDDGAIGTIGDRLILANQTDIVVGTPAESTFRSMLTSPFGPKRLEYAGDCGFYVFDFFGDEDVLKYIGGKVKLSYTSGFGETEADFIIKDIQKYSDAWWDSVTEDYIYPTNPDHVFSTYLVFIESLDVNNAVSALDVTNIAIASFFTKGDIEYDSSDLNGRRVIIAESKNTEEWIHPSIKDYSGTKPIYGPVFTSSYSFATKKFLVNSVLPASNSTNPNISVAGFSLIPERFAVLQASTLGKYNIPIYSNRVQFYIKLNDRDRGVVKTLLNKYVPYGFRLRDSKSQDSSTVNMETFLTVNINSGNSFASPKFPLISYLEGNGIIYSDTVYQTNSSSLDLTLKSTED
jgi:hypothetical protein